jgi:predicted nucleic acid-binding protein
MRDDVLIDAGPLVALLDRSDAAHARCQHVFETLARPPLTVWPALAEASYLLSRIHLGQFALLRVVQTGTVSIAKLDREDLGRMHELMAKYHDLPMDLADAAIVRVAERERINRVFTIDHKDFRVYRPAHIRHFTLLPSAMFPA